MSRKEMYEIFNDYTQEDRNILLLQFLYYIYSSNINIPDLTIKDYQYYSSDKSNYRLL
jgi:hypothetical protein